MCIYLEREREMPFTYMHRKPVKSLPMNIHMCIYKYIYMCVSIYLKKLFLVFFQAEGLT